VLFGEKLPAGGSEYLGVLGHHHGEDAVLAVGGHLLMVGRRRETKRAAKLAKGALHPVDVAALVNGLLLAFSRDLEEVMGDTNVDILWPSPRKRKAAGWCWQGVGAQEHQVGAWGAAAHLGAEAWAVRDKGETFVGLGDVDGPHEGGGRMGDGAVVLAGEGVGLHGIVLVVRHGRRSGENSPQQQGSQRNSGAGKGEIERERARRETVDGWDRGGEEGSSSQAQREGDRWKTQATDGITVKCDSHWLFVKKRGVFFGLL
jgi:hypothetical protein